MNSNRIERGCRRRAPACGLRPATDPVERQLPAMNAAREHLLRLALSVAGSARERRARSVEVSR
jgi:hypothetical protein